MNGHLTKLKELTEKLVAFPSPIQENSGCAYKEYKMEKGECFSWFIHRSGNDIGIHRWFCTKDTVFPEHSHKERELLVIYSGIMNLKIGDKIYELKKGDYFYNPPLIPHSSTYPEDCKFITIMIPPSKDYPYGEVNGNGQ